MKRLQKPAIAILTLVFIVLILANISLSDVGRSLLSIGWWTLALCLLLHFCVYVLRSLAMNVFLSGEVPFRYLLVSHLIHNFYLNILPVNMGELSLPLMLSRFVSKTRSFSVLLITRLVGVLVMLALFLTSVFYVFHGFSQLDLNFSRIVTGIIVLTAIPGMLFLLWKSNLTKLPLMKKLIDKLTGLKNSIVYSFQHELTFAKAIYLILITLAYTTFLALFFQLILTRLSISVSIIEMFFIMSLHLAVLILPIKSFAGIGTTEGVWMLGMVALGIGSKVALESGVVIHIISLFSATVFFLIGLAARHLTDRKAA
jgi:uncharacterized membrane protein YbhN (UPF0104 family)